MNRIAAIIAVLGSCVAASAASILTVRGEARLEVPADQFSITIGSMSTAPTVKEARTEVDATMSKLVNVVTAAGLTRDDEWHTGRYDVTPQWEPRPARTQGSTWTPKIIGYSVRASIAVMTQKMTLAGALIANAAKAGANEISALNFSLADPRSSRAEAIKAATKHAITDATTLANAAGVDLTQILQLSLDGAQATPPRPVEHRYMAANKGRAAFDMNMESAPDISGGTVTVTANVTAEWAIDPKKQ
jgi:uncharacterized protein YggE